MPTAQTGAPPTESEKDSISTTEKSGDQSVDVVAVDPARVAMFWQASREFILPAFERFPGEANEANVVEALLSGRMLLWVAWKDAVIGGCLTEVFVYDGGLRVLRIVALGGIKFETWRETLDELLTEFGRLWRCERVEFYGRKGWEKRLPNYEISKIMMVRSL